MDCYCLFVLCLLSVCFRRVTSSVDGHLGLASLVFVCITLLPLPVCVQSLASVSCVCVLY